MITLRNNTKTSDTRLDRLQQFDERSREYRLRIGTNRLRSYTWRCNANLDQGSEGACVGFGISHELCSRPAEVKGLDNAYARERIYWEAQKIDDWDGGSYPGASPRYEGTSVLAGVKIAKSLGWFDEYRWAFGIDDLLRGLAYNGPSVLGINWYNGMYSPDAKGFIRPSGTLAGGHCILARAINARDEFITLRNSWGAAWGKGGDCYISFADMDKLLKEDGESVFFVKRHHVSA